MIRQGKTWCSCLLQTFNSSKYRPLSPVQSHARLNKITQSGLLIPLLLGFFKIPSCSHTNTCTPIHPPFFVKKIKAVKQVLKSLEASTFTSVDSSPPLCCMVIYHFCKTLASVSRGECFWESPLLEAVPQ